MKILDQRQRLIDIITSKLLPQQKYTDAWRFEEIAKAREFSCSLAMLESWDQLGIFHPIYRLQSDSVPSQEDASSQYKKIVQLPTDDTYKPWAELSQTPISSANVVYHPYQVFRLWELCNSVIQQQKVYFTSSVSREDWNKAYDVLNTGLERSVEEAKNDESNYLKELALLLLVEDRYLPYLRQRISLQGFSAHRSQDWHEWAKAFEPQSVLEASEFTIEEIKEYRLHLAHYGQIVDPNEQWFVLTRHINHEKREKLKGKALLAWDYYEAAEVLGLFLKDLTGEVQPHIDDIGYGSYGGEWKKTIYGVAPQDFNYYKANALPSILRNFGLDTRPRVMFIVEGKSESEFVATWCTKSGLFAEADGNVAEADITNLRSLGIQFVALDGIGTMGNPPMQNYVQHARNEGACIVMVIDNENDATAQLNDWLAKGLIDKLLTDADVTGPNLYPLGGLLWQPCFEDANFTFDELSDAWCEILQSKSHKGINQSQIDAALEYACSCKTQGETSIKSLKLAADWKKLPLHKPEIARVLANKFYDSDKPMVLLIRKVLQLATLMKDFSYEAVREAADEV